MSTQTEQLIQLLTQQMALQREQMEQQRRQQEEQLEQQRKQQREQLEQQKEENRQLIKLLMQTTKIKAGETTPNFTAFDPNTELWTDYLLRFWTFIGANSITEDRVPQMFLTNQSKVIYKQLTDWSDQQTPKKEVNKLTIEDIENYMMIQYNPRTFIVRERYRYWSNMKRNPEETI
ncbi:AT-rich binding protein-like [Watersipora subatra]|uniref:AT-rich binding protein-like n=1 Tax=Watersipora subatra TaxID=2589382 RepID=UPI00355C6A6E